jgi:hypothetical protein
LSDIKNSKDNKQWIFLCTLGIPFNHYTITDTYDPGIKYWHHHLSYHVK